ncbi:hypothetical protein [Anabaena azotica]|uniref:Uncharacterized protein n=1 Tax=Anabaena azotica FACHB-119 TaxID=947527 RepID=A0ABR8CZH0_9NOST|nr:hypothetical protein [Anabaena azotica]MBD2499879.1 hypothetical protein [Anabaena azotica FACHB-119]
MEEPWKNWKVPQDAIDWAKALLPDRRPKQRLLDVIKMLDTHGELTEYNARLIEAIALSSLWDEEAYLKFEALGLELAKEQFDLAFINCEHDETIGSPENPRNWKK